MPIAWRATRAIVRPRRTAPDSAATIVRRSAPRAIADGRHTVRKLTAKREPIAVRKVASASRSPAKVAAATAPTAASPSAASTAARAAPAAVPAALKADRSASSNDCRRPHFLVIPAKAGTQPKQGAENQSLGEIAPTGIISFDQLQLPRAVPFLDPLSRVIDGKSLSSLANRR
jgi:hypothetical protein